MKDTLRLLFGFDEPVTRRLYIIAGLSLFALKYAVDCGFMYLGTGNVLNPIEYMHPSLTMRWEALMGKAPAELGFWWFFLSAIWALPFIWIGVSMSARRARNAGVSPWIALLFFVPLVNLLVMLGLSVAKTDEGDADREAAEAALPEGGLFRNALLALFVAPVLGVGLTSLSVFGAGTYGAAVFLGTPFVMGVVCAYLVNRDGHRGWKPAVLSAMISIVVCGGVLILTALEGAICLITAAPICFVLAILGALAGTAITKATHSGSSQVSAMALGLPLLMAIQLDAGPTELPVYPVTTEIEIGVPPDKVWPNVVGFSELPPPENWMMKTGIAVPLRARIEGSGVGAVRYCEFSTGPFVEPITVWDPPHRLGFDVIEQPPSMEEWSPYQVVHAPHLVGTMVSRRGQFKLEPLPNGGTRLIGTTWYTLDMAPAAYWTLWSDWVIHGIHTRVLKHIKSLSERAG